MTEFAKNFEDLLVWQKARELNLQIYKLTKSWKDFSLKDQIQRASVSISSNIAEGFERSSRDDFAKFLLIARGSISEVKSQLYLSLDLNYLTEKQFSEIEPNIAYTTKMLTKLVQSLRPKRLY